MVCGVKGKRVEGYKLRLDLNLMGFVVLNCQGYKNCFVYCRKTCVKCVHMRSVMQAYRS